MINIQFNFKLIRYKELKPLTDEQARQINKVAKVNVTFAYTDMFVLQIKIHHGYWNLVV